MAIIGVFKKSGDRLQGNIRTLSLNTKATLVPNHRGSDAAPDYRVFADNVEIGAAWERTARGSGMVYHSVKLDDPSLPAPIFASLFLASETPEEEAHPEGDAPASEAETYNLVWSR